VKKKKEEKWNFPQNESESLLPVEGAGLKYFGKKGCRTH
jgi:hypothetical protein